MTQDTAGTYKVDVDRLSGSLVVKEIAPIAATEEIADTPAPVSEPNWWLVGGIIASVVVAGLVLYLLVWRKRGTAKSGS